MRVQDWQGKVVCGGACRAERRLERGSRRFWVNAVQRQRDRRRDNALPMVVPNLNGNRSGAALREQVAPDRRCCLGRLALRSCKGRGTLALLRQE